jgi:hypothetical protein
MALSFNGSTQYLKVVGVGNLAYPLTFSAWVVIDTDSGTGTWLFIYRASDGSVIGLDYQGSTDRWEAIGRTTAGAYLNASYDESAPTGKLVHLCAVYTSSTARQIYVNAVAGTANTLEVVLGGTKDALYAAASWVPGGFFAGRMFDLAIWSAALSSTEIEQLKNRVSPLLVRPNSLSYYWPLYGRQSVETDVIQGLQWAHYGTPPQADNFTSIIQPSRPKIVIPPAVVGHPARKRMAGVPFASPLPRIW